MTTVQITLTDDLVQRASSAGLLSPEAMETLLRDELKRRAGSVLRAVWKHGPGDELTPAVEDEIADAVSAQRAAPHQA